MKTSILILLSFLMYSISYAQTIEGRWNTGKENTIIEFLQKGGEWEGKIKSSDNDKAPIGKVILKDMKKQGDSWIGKLFVIQKQRWVDVKIRPAETSLDLLVSAGFSKRNIEWKKAK